MLMIRPLQPSEIGGGKVLKKFNAGGRARLNGEMIGAEEIRTWVNLTNLMELGYIECWPKHVAVVHQERRPDEALRNPAPAASAPIGDGDVNRMVITKGFGLYDVIEGRVLAKGVSKKDAHGIARIPFEADPPSQLKRPVGRPRKTPNPVRPSAPHLRSHASAEPPAMPAGVGPKEDNGPID